jgi:N-acetylneuraminic acid mutarotase
MKVIFSVFSISLLILCAFTFMSDDGRKDLTQKNTSVSNETVVVNGPALDYPLSTLSESFEGATFPPAGWVKLNPDGGTGWASITSGTTPLPGWNGGVATVPTGGGTKTAYASWNTGGTTANDQWIVTPQITNVQPNDTLKFWLRKPGYCNNYLDHFDVKISTTTPVVASFTTTVVAMSHPAASPDSVWIEYKFRLGNFVTAGANIYIGFREWVLDNTNDGSAYQLDLVSVVAGSAPPTTCSKTANAWCPLAKYPSLPAATYFEESTWIGDTLYVHAPSSAGAASTTVYKWTYGAASWSTGVPCLTAVIGASLTTCNNKMYLIGGGTSAVTTGSTNVQEYNPATGTWTAKAPLPLALAAHGSVCWGDSVIFVVGGPYSSSASNLNVYYYRPATDSWGTISNSLPSGQGRRTFALGICGNKIIMSCGYNTVYLNSTYVGTIGSNASSITWAVAPVLPGPALSRPAGIGYENRFYVSGGDTNTTAVKNDKVYIFNTATNSWVGTILSNPNPVSNMMNGLTAKCISDTIRLFQPGGYNASSVGTANFVITGCGTVTGISTNQNLPKQYSLSQNYPNPFNPVTKISYELPKSGLVTLKIYDVLGKEVVTLVNEVKNAGSYSVDFNGASLSSGVYFYRLESNGFVSIKKMMLIK